MNRVRRSPFGMLVNEVSAMQDEFNRLMLTMAGAWGMNVYLRPSTDALVDLKAGARGVIVEYSGDFVAASGQDRVGDDLGMSASTDNCNSHPGPVCL